MVASDYFEAWYSGKGWKSFAFQQEMFDAWTQGYNGLLNAPTGSGKTYAVWIPIISHWMAAHPDYQNRKPEGLKVLWITPLRALAKDICNALQEACDTFSLPWRVETRTGDTPLKQKQAQMKKMPECLVTTPESLHIFLARKGYPKLLSKVDVLIVDEWHELLGSKRGVQAELGLSRLKALRPDLRVWGISATIGNLVQAMEVLLGSDLNEDRATVVRANIKKQPEVVTILPDDMERLPWGGHLGIKLLEKVIPIIWDNRTTLIFTNTRAQAEIWYQKILDASPDLAGLIAMHHGSLDSDLRSWVEDALHAGSLKAVVCTSSLDLGVDFRPVDTVVQIGGPKGVARFIQRAGRSGHSPGEKSRIYFLPTNALELLEAAALKRAVKQHYVEKRLPVLGAIDVLVQYLVTLAVSEGFYPGEIFEEVTKTYGYADLSTDEWNWCLNFITQGGASLSQYDEYSKVEVEEGFFKVRKQKVARRHRLHIGTIVSDTMIKVRFITGGFLGTIEEYFVAKLTPGDTFFFAGRNLEFIMFKEMTALVRLSKSGKGQIPAYGGGRMPFSSYMTQLLREELTAHQEGKANGPEAKALKPLLDLQRERSIIPAADELLIEKLQTNEGCHLFVYPFEGYLVHEVMAGLLAYRIGHFHPSTYSIAMNDYGFELLSDEDIPIEKALEMDVFSSADLQGDIERSLNAAEMAQRRFRDIACIAGLTFQGFPGKYKKGKHLQSSTQLIFKVFMDYDPKNLLLRQSFEEVFEFQLEEARLRGAFMQINEKKVRIEYPEKPTPLAFPIMVERIRTKLTTESLENRIRKMKVKYDD